jgi:hypothetical protein
VNPERAVSYRKQAGTLIEGVLAEEISPRTAINTWPSYGNGDLSVRVAYTMLWFFEADEDRHKQELFYPDLQVKAMKEAAIWLKKGEPLPLRLIVEYEEQIAPEMYNPHRSWSDPVMWLMRQLHTMRCILETHPLIARYSRPTR